MDGMEGTKVLGSIEALADQRRRLEIAHRNLAETISISKPPLVQELVLAQRHIEDARMRLGVALTLQNGKNPWSSPAKI